ncbi:MAG: hypothetical protein JSR98_22150 [Proteobacteria bacterium]|nr:hypothetical protein [Pseudomonadota bacterium]
MRNLIWPSVVTPNAGPSGWIGRTVHWTGVALAAAILLTALGFAVDGWSTGLAVRLAAVAIVMALASRGIRYLLAHE